MGIAPEKVEDLLSGLSPRLQAHVRRTEEAARVLAERFGLDVESASPAALLHDIAREKSGEELLKLARDYRLTIGRLEKQAPMLLHGPVAAAILRWQYGLRDPAVLHAIAWHATGRVGMSELEKVILVADKMESGRDFPGVEEVRKLAERDLDAATIRVLDQTILYVIGKGGLLHPATVEARNDLLARRGKREETGN